MAAPELTRLDAALVARGIARSRTVAARLIDDGMVTVDGRPAVKASLKVSDATEIAVREHDAWVSRGAIKLIAALDQFGIDPTGRLALDAGASTGGFTQVLLSRDVRRVIAVDVGHGQLAPEIAIDGRVQSHEGVNVRDLDPARLASLTGSDEEPALIVADLSFISLGHVLPALASIADPVADVILLIKPQFEVGRTGIREGIVRDPGLRADAIAQVLWAAWDVGLGTTGLIPSPIAGTAGNHEYLVHLRASPAVNPTEWEASIPSIAGA
ncbi:TlyA family RNA methyltransferase [Amnibacterium flavum]|uniref:TlyA family rRNA (Cytidine-2'-O)-methyltransferase n=1 Tax=Amnibacterium flavum TaxID=2173173 RepID=A0A2V1HQL0_9MICO|nr:TlyA family RNA methyltransferase [Amnibacterium flavum]PVZ94825.1 TlyA family rRNA (cytidine-2'-O)-methyltransferase [Amnibacterium flavum]